MTLNNLIALFQTYQEADLRVNSFVFGDASDVDNQQDSDGVVMWAFIDPSPASIQSTEIRYSFQIAFLDVLNKDDSNLRDVLSDTFTVCLDFVSWLDKYDDTVLEYSIDRTANIQAVKDRFESEYAGHTVGVTFTLPFDYDTCQIPLISGAALPTACSLFLGRLTSEQLSCISGSALFSTTVNVYVNGVLNQTATFDPLVNNTINITA
jgi:hypothetical protein